MNKELIKTGTKKSLLNLIPALWAGTSIWCYLVARNFTQPTQSHGMPNHSQIKTWFGTRGIIDTWIAFRFRNNGNHAIIPRFPSGNSRRWLAGMTRLSNHTTACQSASTLSVIPVFLHDSWCVEPQEARWSGGLSSCESLQPDGAD